MNIAIRPLKVEDALVSWRWRNDREVFEPTIGGFFGDITPEKELQWIITVLARRDERRFAIEADGKYVGNIYLTEITPVQALTGLFIGNKEYWNKGVGSAALSLLVDYAFGVLKCKSVYCYIKKQNIASVKTHQKIGYRIVSEEKGILTLVLNNT